MMYAITFVIVALAGTAAGMATAFGLFKLFSGRNK